jgi:hypothetical protein
MATVEVASGPGSRQEPCWEDVYSIIWLWRHAVVGALSNLVCLDNLLHTCLLWLLQPLVDNKILTGVK